MKASVRLEWAFAAETVHDSAKYPLGSKKKAELRRLRRRTVNKDQVSGKVEQAVGKVKQSVGETLGNERLANQGVVDQAKGAARNPDATIADPRFFPKSSALGEQSPVLTRLRSGA